MNLKPRPKTADIARLAGVSKAAVSFVLNGGTAAKKVSPKKQEEIRKIARDLGYIPNQIARSLRGQRARMVGLLFADLTANWAHRVMQGMEDVFREKRFGTIISLDYWDAKRQYEELVSLDSQLVNGIIVIAPWQQNMPLLLKLASHGTRISFFGDAATEVPFNCVMWNEAQAIRLAVRHLLDIGRKRICLVTASQPPGLGLRLHQDRIDAFHEVLTQSGIPANDQFTAEIRVGGDAHKSDFAPPWDNPHGYDALLAANDLIGLQLLECLAESEIKIPQQVAVMGICNHPISGNPLIGLSTVDQPLRYMARIAARQMVNLIENAEAESANIVIPAERLCVRSSTVPGALLPWKEFIPRV